MPINYSNQCDTLLVTILMHCFLFSSPMSDVAGFLTSGTTPSQPDPPMLSERFVTGLCISWIRRPNDDNFVLQMEDSETVST